MSRPRDIEAIDTLIGFRSTRNIPAQIHGVQASSEQMRLDWRHPRTAVRRANPTGDRFRVRLSDRSITRLNLHGAHLAGAAGMVLTEADVVIGHFAGELVLPSLTSP